MSIEEFIPLCEVSIINLRGANGESTHNRIITESWSVHKGILIREFFQNILPSCSS